MKDTGWTFQGYRVFESESAPNPIGIRHIGTHKERTMTINHIDQLAQWYESAEQITKTNLPRAGDTLILPYNAGGYAIEAEGDDWTPDDLVPGEPVRILARAPKPKPAWHDAVAVTARYDDTPMRYALLRDGDRWINGNGEDFMDDELEDVTPLVEAKVTDEMVERLEGHFLNTANMALPEGLARRMLTAALGLETE